MSAFPSAVAALAVAIAFGFGYSTRLAAAWIDGGVRVVDAAPTSDVRSNAPFSQPFSRPSARRTRTKDADPPAPPDADAASAAEAAPDDVATSTEVASADDVYAKAMYDVFSRAGQVDAFRRAVDDVAETPLGRSPEDLGLLDASSTSPVFRPLVEGIDAMRARLSAVNAAASPSPPDGDFQFAAFRRGGRFETVVGDAGLAAKLAISTSAACLAGESGRTPAGVSVDDRPSAELTAPQWDALLRLCADARREDEAARRAFWSRLRGLAASGAAAPLDPLQAVAACVAAGRCVVVRAGDDPELDRLVEEADRAERAVRADVESALRR